MDFFEREEEIRELRKVRELARRNARFTVVTGRRRVGMTALKFFEKNPTLRERMVSYHSREVNV